MGAAEPGAVQDPDGLILIEVAFGLAFCTLLFRAFIATIPRDLDEAAIIDGAGPARLFFKVIFPLLRSVIVTVVIVQSVAIFNDFANPLYFLPGDENATVQLTVFNFQSQFSTQYNLLFADILLITIPPLLLFLFLNKRIVEGMTAGAVKGWHAPGPSTGAATRRPGGGRRCCSCLGSWRRPRPSRARRGCGG